MTDVFEGLFMDGAIATALLDTEGQIICANRQLSRFFGYSCSELDGHSISSIIPATNNGPPLVEGSYEFQGLLKDRSTVPVLVRIRTLDVDGRSIVVCSVTDDSVQDKTQEQLLAAFEAAPNGMLMVNSSGRVVRCNNMIEEIFGYARHEIEGYGIEVLVPHDVRNRHHTFVSSYVGNDPKSRPMGAGRDLFGRHKSGRLIPVEIGLRPLRFDGETYIISSIVDITKRRLAEDAIRRKTQEIEEFSYCASHDLRSPLKSIAGIADCILDDIQRRDLESAARGAEMTQRVSAKLITLVDDILTLTKLDHANEPVDAFDFDEYAATARDRFGGLLDAHDVVLEFDFAHTESLVIQPTRLTQTLDNLVSNAIKYCDNDKPRRSVNVRTFDNDATFHIEIEDNGQGIPEDKLAKVFSMFSRFSKSSQGSGLGLYIAKKQVDHMGASIRCTSSPAGTTFHIECKLSAPEVQASVKNSAETR